MRYQRRSVQQTSPAPWVVAGILLLLVSAAAFAGAMGQHNAAPGAYQVASGLSATPPSAPPRGTKPTLTKGAAAIHPTRTTAGLAPDAPTYTVADALAFMKHSNTFGASCVQGAVCRATGAVFMTAEQMTRAYGFPLSGRAPGYPICVVEFTGTFAPSVFGGRETFPHAVEYFDGRTGDLMGLSLVNAFVKTPAFKA